MLALLPSRVKKIPLEHVLPYSEDDLMIISSPDVAFALKKIQDDNGRPFSIKNVVETNQSVFGSQAFEERCTKFSEIMDSRIERVFITKKAEYVFFDSEEQQKIREILANNCLAGIIEIFVKKDGKFEPVEIEKTKSYSKNFQQIRNGLKKIGAVYMMTPDLFVRMNSVYRANEERNQAKVFGKMDGKLDAVFALYPELHVSSKAEFTRAYKKLAKQTHPDLFPGDDEKELKFKELQEAITIIEKTRWYKKLK